MLLARTNKHVPLRNNGIKRCAQNIHLMLVPENAAMVFADKDNFKSRFRIGHTAAQLSTAR